MLTQLSRDRVGASALTPICAYNAAASSMESYAASAQLGQARCQSQPQVTPQSDKRRDRGAGRGRDAGSCAKPQPLRTA